MGPCVWCGACVDNENGICLLLMREVRNSTAKDKCIVYQPKGGKLSNESVHK